MIEIYGGKRDAKLKEHFGLLESFSEIKSYNKLNEAEKNQISKEIVESMFNLAIGKFNKVDTDIIDDTKGNFKDLKGYIDVKNTLDTLDSMRAQQNIICPDLDIVQNALKNLIDNTKNFEQGYRVESSIIKLFYVNIATAIITSTSFLLSSLIDYVKDINGDYTAILNKKKNSSYDNLFVSALKSFNDIALNGDLQKFFNQSLSKQGFAISTGLFIGSVSAMGLILIGLSIVPIIREIIYQFYYMRLSLKDMLMQQASFLQMNSVTLANTRGNKDAAKKQDAIAKSLIKMADKVNVEEKTSTKKAQIDIKKENNTISLDSPSPEYEVAQNTGYGNLL